LVFNVESTHMDVDLKVDRIYGWDNVRAGSKTKLFLLLQISSLVQTGVKYRPQENGMKFLQTLVKFIIGSCKFI